MVLYLISKVHIKRGKMQKLIQGKELKYKDSHFSL